MITREEYEKAVATIEAYAKQLEDEMQGVKAASARRVGIDIHHATKELPQKGDIIEITEAFGNSEYLTVGSKHKVVKAVINKHSKRGEILLSGQVVLRTNLYNYKIVS